MHVIKGSFTDVDIIFCKMLRDPAQWVITQRTASQSIVFAHALFFIIFTLLPNAMILTDTVLLIVLLFTSCQYRIVLLCPTSQFLIYIKHTFTCVCFVV